MSNQNKIGLLKQNLFQLDLNFNDIKPPDLEEVIEYQKSRNGLHPKLLEMINGGAAERFYAAILLSVIDEAKSNQILQDLKNESTLIKVQDSVGFGLIEVPVKYPAESFRQTGDIRKGFIEKAERLKKWQSAIKDEANKKNISLDVNGLPTLIEVYDSRFGESKKHKIKKAIENLVKDEIVAKRFYAVELLDIIDREESKQILLSLTQEETPILVFFGDIAQELPAKIVAAECMKNHSEENQDSNNQPTDFSGRFWNSLKNLSPFGKSR